MRADVCCGKGGVGKTLTASSLALYFARTGKKKTALIDFDGGHSTLQTLGIEFAVEPNTLTEIERNLSIVIVENTEYVPARAWKYEHPTFDGYLEQFPDDSGIVALADMLDGFFGIPTDVTALQKFVVLVQTLNALEEAAYDNVVIDVEPTAGLQRLLGHAEATQRSLKNVKQQNAILRDVMHFQWPDIAADTQVSYIQHIEKYAQRIERAVDIMRNGHYMLIATPKRVPIEQTFQVREIIEGFGGRVDVCVVNDLRGDPGEEANIRDLAPHNLRLARIWHIADLDDLPVDAKRDMLLRAAFSFFVNITAR